MATWNAAKNRWDLSATEIGAWDDPAAPQALYAEVASKGRIVTVFMDDEVDLVFPAEVISALAGQPLRELRKIQIEPGGRYFGWPALGVRVSVEDVIKHGPAGEAAAPAPRRKRAEASSPMPSKVGAIAPFPAATELTGVAILHGTWVPDEAGSFDRAGTFHVWVELATEEEAARHLAGAILESFVKGLLGAEHAVMPAQMRLLLPSTPAGPLPSPEAGRWREQILPEAAALGAWRLGSLTLAEPLSALPALRFAALQRPEEVQLGADLAAWCRFAIALKSAIVRDQYVPALRLAAPEGKGKNREPAVRATWEFLSPGLEQEIRQQAERLPAVCRAGAPADSEALELSDGEALLAHMAAVTLHRLIRGLKLPKSFLDRLDGTLLATSVMGRGPTISVYDYDRWRTWRDRLARAHTAPAFDLAFQLGEPDTEDGPWSLAFLAVSRRDPSLKLALDAPEAPRMFGRDFLSEALLLLGQAARMVPLIWRGLQTDRPTGLTLSLSEAYEFLRNDAWLLEDAGFKVLVPAWWTPQGRKRVRAKLTPVSARGKAAAAAGGQSPKAWLSFRYELAIGEEPVSIEEWEALVAAKTPLVRFRGAWVELDTEQMARIQELVKAGAQAPTALSPLELVRLAAEADTGDVVLDESLEALVERLSDPRALSPVTPPAGLRAELREYQRRGLDWLVFLDELGLNGCLADDMGLGKTVQVIARLVHEREQDPKSGPTLLIAPTSVIGNWQKELARFAPGLKATVHHGAARADEVGSFADRALATDVVITSYALVRRDEALFTSVNWQRVVLDEAQNIKNPQAAQTRAIRKLKAEHRLALTGTPVENRLLDLWSLFDFLNPGYLGKEAGFRKTFETPIQRDADAERAALLRRLTGPLVLRRVKTDPAIISDLPDKVEQKLYCPLTPEQASLYEAVVKEASETVESATGIQRKGAMLATLTKLKQVCNHPAQLLQDGSAFDAARSHKLSRLADHAHEILHGGESLLVFTQFAELGGQLERFLRQALGAEVHFLHGGTSREARDRMIAAFQDPASPPSVFVLSLKAGGVGITLTKANHVFHFDRWWNPAVEEQATDRAFRIGQTRNVFVHKFVTLGTLEERIDAMLEDKKRLAASVVGTDESWLATLDNEAFKALIALDRAAVMA